MSPIEFWFDFSSPYAYFAAHQIESLAERHGRSVAYRPFALGALFKVTGMAPLTEQPLRGAYARRDWDRLARLHGLPFMLPDPFPVRTLTAARTCLLAADADPALVGPFVREGFAALFGRGEQIDRPEVLRECLAAAGLDPAIADWAGAAEAKERFVRQTEEARRRGVFGSPFFIVDDEPFWGADRLPMLELFLDRGAW